MGKSSQMSLHQTWPHLIHTFMIKLSLFLLSPSPPKKKREPKQGKKEKMSVATSVPCIKLKISHHSSHRSSNLKAINPSFIVRGSKAEGPLRRPSAPSLSPPPPLSPPTKPITPSQPQPQSQPAKAKVEAGVTLEYQRKMAKEMQDYFKQKKLEEADQGPFFGFTGKNEIANGR